MKRLGLLVLRPSISSLLQSAMVCYCEVQQNSPGYQAPLLPYPGVLSNMAYTRAIYVVVQFYPWFNFYFPLFLGMVIYDNEFETKENKN